MLDIINKLREIDNGEIVFLNIYPLVEKMIIENSDNFYSFYFNSGHLSRKGALELTDYFRDKLLDK